MNVLFFDAQKTSTIQISVFLSEIKTEVHVLRVNEKSVTTQNIFYSYHFGIELNHESSNVVKTPYLIFLQTLDLHFYSLV